ncbi:MAG: ATP-binding protein [Candidatus Hodarchaeales archaeon]|jgi:replicative DNA helicase Mcm
MSYSFDIKGRFQSFIEDFTDQDGNLHYYEKIRDMEREDLRSLKIDYNDLLVQDPKLAEEIIINPEECFLVGEEIIKSILAQNNPEYLERLNQAHLRIVGMTERLPLRSLKTEHLGLLSCFEGIVIGVTEAKPMMIRGNFKCVLCGERNQIVDFPEGIYNPPYQCRNEQCQRKGSLQLQLEKSVFIDWQKITLQERPEELPPGLLPQSLIIHVLDDLVDQARPGDRVEVVGILKARASRILKRGQLATYSKFFQGVSIDKETAEYIDIDITEEDELRIIDLSKSPYVIEKIRDSLAPSIYGHDLVKEAIASLLFGGTLKETPDGIKLRGESNVLLIGDPGVGKSQILKFISKLAPRAIYTTGKGSTAAGLTAAVLRDPDTGEITLEAGALVLADQGIAMVDEFDKMRPDDRVAIHEAMEQHTISIAKAGIVATLNARTSILAAANPRRGRWNPYRDPAENLNLPPTLLSRFDLLFVLEDKPHPQEDHDKGSHILNIHQSQTLSRDPPIEQDLLRKYIAYARREVRPRLTDEAKERLLEYYLELRQTSGEIDEKGPDPIAITPRQLESLVRLSEARAKMRLSDEVSFDDASGAVNLMNATLEKLAKDADTGKLDIDKVSSGISAKSRRRLDKIDNLIDRMLEHADDAPVAIKDIIDQAIEEGIDKSQVVRAIDEMTRRGILFEPEQGHVKRP